MKKLQIRRRIDDAAGRLCEVLIPIKDEYYLGNGNTTAVCTLGSLNFLREIYHHSVMNDLVIAGRLLSENKGIDSLLTSIWQFSKLSKLIVCGNDIPGHLPGHSLIMLHRNGLDSSRRIIGSKSPYPFLLSSDKMVDHFRRDVEVIDKIGNSSLSSIAELIA